MGEVERARHRLAGNLGNDITSFKLSVFIYLIIKKYMKIEHSLHMYAILTQICSHLNLDKKEKNLTCIIL